MQQQELEIEIPSGKIAAIAFGPTNGYPILAAHGWLDNAASFIPLAQILQDFRIIAIDLPGHGLSAHRPPGSYIHFVECIPDMIQIANKLQWDKFALLGHSLGAAICTVLASVMPEKITALVLIDALGPYSLSSAKLPELMQHAVIEYSNIENKTVPAYQSKEEAKAKRLAASPMIDRSIDLLIERGLRLDPDNKYRWRTDPRLLIKPLMMYSEEQVDCFLQRIDAPTCLIRATEGWPFTEESFISRTHLVKNIETHTIPGKHHVHMDEPTIVGNILKQFFKKSIVSP